MKINKIFKFKTITDGKRKINVKTLIVNIVFLVMLFSAYGLYVFNNQKKPDGDIEISKVMASNKKFDKLKIINVRALRNNGLEQMLFSIKNDTGSDYFKKSAKIVFLDKYGSVQDKVDILIPDIKNGESVDYIYALSKEKFSSYNFVISDK